MNPLARLPRPLGLLLGCALLAAVFLTSLGARRVDLWWQLAEGRSILATHHLPDQAPAAFGLPRRPFVDEYSLYEIALSLLDRLGGLAAIHLAFIAGYLAIFLIPLLASRKIPRDLLSATLLALAGIFLVNRYEQRPELVGVLFLTLLVALLREAPGFTPGLLLRIALLFALWTNVHSSYVIGLAALGLWLVDRLVWNAPRWKAGHAALTLAVATGALLVNPYGAARIAFTVAQENDLGSNLLSREMWPIWDQPLDVRVLMVVAGFVLAIVFVARPRAARWLLALAAGLFLLTIWHFRHMSFLAVPLLFLAADRPSAWVAPRWLGPSVLALGAGCVAVLLFDAVAARSAWSDFTAGESQRNRGFAPGLFARAQPGAVLCHDAEGSFLSRSPAGRRPLIDSGQGRFDDATKRFYFFAVEDPEAFRRALHLLPAVDAVVVTPPVEGWTLAMIAQPGWYLAGIDTKGLLFRRSRAFYHPRLYAPIGVHDEQAYWLGRRRDEALSEHDLVLAFCFDAPIASPAESLALLDRSLVSAWSEAFFSFTREWILGLPADGLAAFVESHPRPANPLLRELFLAQDNQPLSPSGPSALERLARVLTLLERNQPAEAKALFKTISRPKVSPLYYTLRAQLEPDAAPSVPGAEQWQDRNAGGPAWFDQLAASLNERADTLIGSSKTP